MAKTKAKRTPRRIFLIEECDRPHFYRLHNTIHRTVDKAHADIQAKLYARPTRIMRIVEFREVME